MLLFIFYRGGNEVRLLSRLQTPIFSLLTSISAPYSFPATSVIGKIIDKLDRQCKEVLVNYLEDNIERLRQHRHSDCRQWPLPYKGRVWSLEAWRGGEAT